ncbi:MAG TPA: hypothetical protein VNS62_15230, partial [Candidatus Udaeobacter sp.]|nr:hypothetical protein [Candidatus Udaeobacter sp.]
IDKLGTDKSGQTIDYGTSHRRFSFLYDGLAQCNCRANRSALRAFGCLNRRLLTGSALFGHISAFASGILTVRPLVAKSRLQEHSRL